VTIIGFIGDALYVAHNEPAGPIIKVAPRDPINYNPACKNAKGEKVDFLSHGHEGFSRLNLPSLVAIQDDPSHRLRLRRAVKTALSFRSSPLLEACARNMILHARETDCAVVRRLRDEQGYSKDKLRFLAIRSVARPYGRQDSSRG
jgi:hypothetical protein